MEMVASAAIPYCDCIRNHKGTYFRFRCAAVVSGADYRRSKCAKKKGGIMKMLFVVVLMLCLGCAEVNFVLEEEDPGDSADELELDTGADAGELELDTGADTSQ